MAEIQTQRLPYKQSGFEAVHAQGAAEGAAKEVKTPFADMTEKAFDGAVKGIDAFMKRAVQLDDFSARQAADVQLNRTLTDAQSELDRRLELPDGDDESFYDAGGTLRQNQMQDFLGRYREQIAGVSRAGILPQTREELYWKSEKAGDQLAANLIAAGVKRQRQKAESSFNDNYKLAMEQNRWGDAAAIAQDGANAGVITQSRADLLAFGAQKTAWESNFRSVAETNPRAAGAILTSSEAGMYLRPDEQTQWRANIQKLTAEEAERAYLNNTTDSKTAENVTGVNSTKNRTNTAPNNPLNGWCTQEELNIYQKLKAGQDVTEDILKEAERNAKAFNPAESARVGEAKFIARWGKFKGSNGQIVADSDLRQIYRDARKKYDELKSASIDAQGLIAVLKKDNILVHRGAWQRMMNEIDASESIESSPLYQQHKAKLNIDENADEETKKYELKRALYEEYAAENREKIEQQYEAWRLKEGAEASLTAQLSKLTSICEQTLDRKTLGTGKRLFEYAEQAVRDTESAQKTANEDQKNAYLNYSNANPLLKFSGNNGLPGSTTTVVAYDNGSHAELAENEILLPKNAMEGVKAGETVVQLTFSDGRVRWCYVAGSCDGNYPLMSSKLGNCGFNTNKTHEVTITPLTPAVGQKAMEYQNKNGKRAMYDLFTTKILESEGRRDRNGNLMVYDTKDAGLEVAGIDMRSHPVEARHLIRLINTGHHAEAERYVRSFYINYTQPAENLLQKAGITHAGVEYLMRDHYLNGGPGGLERVLNNALGLPRNANEKQRVEALKNYKGRENELRVKIRDARDAEYNRIAMVYPSKRRFLAGWRNRNRRAYADSAFMG